MLDDPYYITLLLSGDHQAFTELAHYYYGKIFTVIQARFPQMPRQEVADITQETTFKIYQKIVGFKFTTPADFQAWIFARTITTAIDHYRRLVRTGVITLQQAQSIIPCINYTKTVLGKVVAARGFATASGFYTQREIEMWIHIDQCLERIDEQHKTLLVLLSRGLTPQQIASAENITVDAFYQRKRRAIAALRAEYNK
jgi:RNA polymerase sigma factor (sigma-70 family)